MTLPKLLQINVTANQGSTGKIAEQIGLLAQSAGWESWMAYGRINNGSSLQSLRIGNDIDIKWHGLETRISDNHGLASRHATRQFIARIKKIDPDIIHLHNIHGYYLNYPLLFEFLKEWGGPVVWTLHDCWPMTGHCAYFMMSGCEKWKTGCHDCPSLDAYPASCFIDGSARNFRIKKAYFSSIAGQLTLVPVSDYVAGYLPESFLRDADVRVIHNGIDLDKFRPQDEPKEKIVLGVANVWEPRKGLDDFYKLRASLPNEYGIILVGLSEKQISALPEGILGISRTANQHELARIYSKATALVNPTYEDNYPTVNLEAIACGTPVITYRTGGSPESLTPETGVVLEQGDIAGIVSSIKALDGKPSIVSNCRAHAEANFDQKNCFRSYLDLYNRLLS